MTGKTANMNLVDYRILQGNIKGSIALPVKFTANQTTAPPITGDRAFRPLPYIGLSPARPSGQGPGVGIEQKIIGKTMSGPVRVPWPVDPVTITKIWVKIMNLDMPDIAGPVDGGIKGNLPMDGIPATHEKEQLHRLCMP
jgi:hypothetical protein